MNDFRMGWTCGKEVVKKLDVHRRNAWLTLFSCSRLLPVGSGSPSLPVMSARWNQRSRELRSRGGALQVKKVYTLRE